MNWIDQQERDFRDMMITTHRLPSHKSLRAGSPDVGSVPRETYHQQLEDAGFTVVPDELSFPGASPEIYGRERHPKNYTTAVIYPEGWQAVPGRDNRHFEVVDHLGETVVSVFAKMNDVSDNGYPSFGVAIRGADGPA